MKETRPSFHNLAVLMLLALGLGLSGCASSGDRQVAGNVKKELSRASKDKYRDVEAMVYDGTVQLAGFVSTPEDRIRAAELAAGAKGVRQVVNCISLKSTATGRAEPGGAVSTPPASAETPQPPAEGGPAAGQPPNPKP